MKRYLLAALLLASPGLAAIDDVGQVTPGWIPRESVTGDGTTGVLIDATAEKCAQVWIAEAAGNITGVDVRFATINEEDGITVSLEDLDSSGNPDGVQDQTCTIAMADGDDDTWQACTFGAARTVAIGDTFAIVVQFTSWTDGSLQCESDDYGAVIDGNRYSLHYVSSWTKNGGDPLLVALHYSGTYHPQKDVVPGVRTAVTYNSGTVAQDETAAKFTAPADARLVGVRAVVDLDNAADLVIYDSGSSALETTALVPGARTSTSQQIYTFTLDTPVTLASGSVYRLALKPAGSSIATYYKTTPSAAARNQAPWGEWLVWSDRVDAGSWSDNTSRYPLIQPILDQVHYTSGGGSVTAPMFGKAQPPYPPPGMRMREATVWDGQRFRPGYVLEAGSVGEPWQMETVPAVLHGTARPRPEVWQ